MQMAYPATQGVVVNQRAEGSRWNNSVTPKKRRRRQRGQIEDRIGIYHMCKYINYTEQLKLELSGSLESEVSSQQYL